ncbi:arginine--tRNA ligase [Hymenobacter taeanensis]|uniref:Arginine--tRNA ligase n=1 Tax=Hymenobacter taeanensis TaxID=2735321 RepID=A0A6M6BEI3_9BACT|nr:MULTISPECIES: arginine--tRNA ligase [Hymenobacter]QJX45585.1 arginine--tRNA ligase [Hymenobacter taeanensis]UOQ81166.1 arginine--tRNA ligase [Hymenobacter sp. 5414T-23]
MQQLQQTLKAALGAAIKHVFDVEVASPQLALQPTRKEFAGQFTLVTFSFTKAIGKGPEQIGQGIGDWLVANEPLVSGYNVVKGFLNLEIADAAWLEVFEQLRQQPAGTPVETGGPQNVVVEYSSPNTNKPLHLGHLRNNFLGYSVAEILKATGATVTKANLVNDRGIHICKSMLAYQQYGHGETPQSAGIKGDHLAGKYYVLFEKHYREQVKQLEAEGVLPDVAKRQAPMMLEAQDMLRAWEAGDEDVVGLWKQMNGWVYEGFDETYKNIGVDFDKYYYESGTYLLGKERVEEGLQKGVFFKKEDGSVWVDLKEEGLDEKLLLRADGTSVYITQDLGTAELKFQDFHYDLSVYVIADEQNYHMQVLKAVLKKLGKPYADAIYHLSYGMVDLPSGKMKSREGTVVDADELVREVVEAAKAATLKKGKTEGLSEQEAEQLYHMLGLGALKYYLLKVDPKKRMLFNPEESVSLEGHTGPFIQYSHARISSILRKAAEQGVAAGASLTGLGEIHATEREMIQELGRYAAVVAEAATTQSPAVVAQYAYDIARAYNRFYTEVPIIIEPDAAKKAFRVALSAQTAQTIKASMGLLGIQVPERM